MSSTKFIKTFQIELHTFLSLYVLISLRNSIKHPLARGVIKISSNNVETHRSYSHDHESKDVLVSVYFLLKYRIHCQIYSTYSIIHD